MRSMLCGVAALMRGSCRISVPLSNTKPARKELEYVRSAKAQRTSKNRACRRQIRWLAAELEGGAAGFSGLRRGPRFKFSVRFFFAGVQLLDVIAVILKDAHAPHFHGGG